MSQGMFSARSTDAKCDFCMEQEHRPENEYAMRYKEKLPDRSVLLTEKFRVFPSLGQISEGHVLITPLEHYTAMADLPTAMMVELESICRNVRKALVQAYKQCVFFEHGTRSTESGGCGIYHAHMHAVPIKADLVRETLQQRFTLMTIDSLSKLPTAVPADRSYLFFEDINAKPFVAVADYLPSQYMRKLLSDSIGKSNWDWRETELEPELLRTFETLSSHLARLGVYRV